jgi:glycosyltransferase involved in cell wall biosynthesis
VIAADTLPLVSIIIPVYNGERYLRESLDSILAQTYPRLEVIVMDDASTDSTSAIVASYGDQVKYHRQSQNRGIYGNVNDGIALAHGEFIAVYHADDLYEPTIVEREVASLQRFPRAGAVFCLDIFIDAAGQPYTQLTLPPEVTGGRPLGYPVILNALLTYKNRFLRCPSCMIPAAVYRDLGGYRDTEFRNTSDLEMWLRIARKYPLVIVEEYLFRYRHGHGSSSQRYHRLRTTAENYFRIMDLYLAEGDRASATPEALAAYEAHRAQDNLMITVNHYILGQRRETQAALHQVSLKRLMGSTRIQRVRMLTLYLAMHILVRLPQIRVLANLFYQRWHIKTYGQKKSNQATGNV